jgi:nucleoside-diphosphate-sugar epimerase
VRVRALVTGGTGFVGAALCRQLRARGDDVRALLGPHRPAIAALAEAGVEFRAGDLGDPNGLCAAAEGCELLFHCAGEGSLHASREALSWLNVAGTENALRAARAAGVARVVMLSCADVSLLDRDRVHWKEDAVLGQAPLGAYARSKLLAEELALQASDRALTVIALRPAWLWGPGDHTNLPALCREARSGGVRLFGRGDGLFSTSHVDNVVAALIAAATAQDAGGQAFHVSDPDFLTAREFFTKLCAAVGAPPPRASVYALSYALAAARRALDREGAWPEDVVRRGRACLLDGLRAVRVLDYRAQVTVEDGMQALSAWARQLGGPAAIERLARPPTSAEDIARHRRLADAG